jgi:hypothetical protein
MTDREFAFAILDLMPQDDNWRNFVFDLQMKVRDHDALGNPTRSISFIITIRDEFWFRNKENHLTTSNLFSARIKA